MVMLWNLEASQEVVAVISLRNGAVEHSGLRKNIQQRLPVFIDTAGRNDIPRKWLPGEWILHRNHLPVQVECLRKIPLPLECGGHGDLRERPGRIASPILERIKEEQLLPAGVEHLRY